MTNRWWGILVVLGVAGNAFAQPAAVAVDVAKQREWSHSMHATPLPKQGCFTATYPAVAWTEVACQTPPMVTMVPHAGARVFVIGNGNDVSAQAPTGTISQAIGTFPTVTGVTSESSPIGNNGPSVNDAYTLQINTNPLASAACAGGGASCQGWEQFVYFNNGTTGGSVFIQYWLLHYDAACPAGWGQFQFQGDTEIYCVRNAAQGASTPNLTIGNLANLTLAGNASATGDSVSFSNGAQVWAATGDNFVGASAGWTHAEFNVFGAGGNNAGGGAATFNAGAQVSARVQISYGGNQPPLCSAQGFTGETNNLSFGPGTPAVSPPGPALGFNESTAGGATASCAAAQSIGDTHLTTIAGGLYDFQASGDFVVAETDDFAVHARQVSGAPTWPNADVNHDVGARFGKQTVAVCLGKGAFVDGKPLELGERAPRLFGDLTVGRIGNSYVFVDAAGNSLRADVNATWIDVEVGFAHSPPAVRGLVANTSGGAAQLAARDGTVFTSPFPFESFYGTYGESWRVRDALLAPCGEGAAGANPTRTFYATDLEPAVREKAQGVCVAHGVAPGPWLAACTLDVAVLGTDAAATVFATLPPPAAVGEISPAGGGGGGGGGLLHWWWLALLILILLILIWLLARRRRP